MEFDGKVAVVTGAGRGIGRSIAVKLASLGAWVVVNDWRSERAQETTEELADKGYKALAMAADVSSSNDVRRMVDRVLEEWGAVDILVNNAGLGVPAASVLDIKEEDWDRVLAVDLKGVFLCCQAVMKIMMEKRWGKIVNIASLAGRSASVFGGAHYTAAKAGVLGFTRHLARELAPYNVNVNAICPGVVETPALRGLDLAKAAERIPLGRVGKPGDIAEVVAFLASDASSYMTGATLDVNGGLLMI